MPHILGACQMRSRHIPRPPRPPRHPPRRRRFRRGGGPLAADLADLYAYVTLRLTHANLRNDPQALDECLALMQPLREAWASIAPQA